jgi:hypothetical protein
MSAAVRIRRGDDGLWYLQRPTIQVHGAQWIVLFGPWSAVERFDTWPEAVTRATGGSR